MFCALMSRWMIFLSGRAVPVVDVLHSQTDLDEPVQDLLLGQRVPAVLGAADAVGEVSARRVLHHDVQLLLGGAVDLLEPHDVLVVQQLQDLRFLLGGFLLVGGEVGEVDLLDHPLRVRLHLPHQEGAPVRPAPQQFLPPVDLRLFLDGVVLRVLHAVSDFDLLYSAGSPGGQWWAAM